MPVGRVIVPSVAKRIEKQAGKIIVAKAANDGREAERLQALADRLAPQVRREFLAAVERVRDRIDVRRVAELLERGDVGGAFDLVSQVLTERGFARLAALTGQAALGAGVAASAALAERPFTQLDVSFSVTNPRTADFLNRYEMDLIRELTDQARLSVRTAILEGVQDGRNPLDVARDVREFVGLTERQTLAVVNFRRMLEEGDREVLTRALRDRRFDPTVRAWLDGDLDLSREQVDRMVSRYAERYLRHRSETIARTEAARATQTGNHELWRQAVEQGQMAESEVRRSWIYTHDDRVRDAHVAIPAMNPDGVGLNEPFWSPLGPIMYPGDPSASAANTINCRCTVIYRYVPQPQMG